MQYMHRFSNFTTTRRTREKGSVERVRSGNSQGERHRGRWREDSSKACQNQQFCDHGPDVKQLFRLVRHEVCLARVWSKHTCFWDSRQSTDSTARVNSVMARMGCILRDFEAPLCHNKAANHILAPSPSFFCEGPDELFFFQKKCCSPIGIQQYSVQLLPLSVGQFFWSVVWFDSALILWMRRALLQDCVRKLFVLLMKHPLRKVLFWKSEFSPSQALS